MTLELTREQYEALKDFDESNNFDNKMKMLYGSSMMGGHGEFSRQWKPLNDVEREDITRAIVTKDYSIKKTIIEQLREERDTSTVYRDAATSEASEAKYQGRIDALSFAIEILNKEGITQ
ncbi:hypothetical protein 031MP004_57 [Bacillus phage 031MP004]|nr:hypothetical protein 022DV001_56 [Bacillus phage 022DV001]QFG05459.1 hypothetical protein 031MP003_59 [Bacillus phage 031MP003]QFG05548.1 hypothetical protein 031MP002_58 [Bacillus phage 031MP002]QFG05634.1 hypothetical protein 031MP004_57 [Bacillus phage 031MP004]QFG05806.1 hypothetical protein 055SW001_56 [Bacillus phage 055SW001]